MNEIRNFLLKCALVLIFGILGTNSGGDPFSKQPRIAVQDGHMTIYSALNRNVSLSATGQGTVQVNNIDISRRLSSGQSTMTASGVSMTARNVRHLLEISNSYSSLLSQVNHLEENMTDIAQRLNQFIGGDQNRITNRGMRRYFARVKVLEDKVTHLTELLSTNECSSNPCRNGGTCVDSYNGFVCNCPSNWEGPHCENDVNECAIYAGTAFGCQNGATCINLQGSYRCDCAHNWFGIHCSQQHDDCSAASSFELCGHGTCVNEKRVQPGQAKYKCICDEGWTNSATNPACIQDVDECQDAQTKCSRSPLVQCYNIPGSFHCGPCPAGYTGNGFWCADINECEYQNGGCSMNPLVECHNTLGSRRCGPCPNGYFGNGEQCMYQSVCSNNRGGCHPLATCIDNPAISVTYRECRCPPGYAGSGEGLSGCVQSEAMTCANNPCQHGTCQMVGNSYHCTCYSGYYGTHCEFQQNICLSQPCQNGGTCIPGSGTFTCNCANDYTGPTCTEPKQLCGGHKNENNGTLRYPTDGHFYGHGKSCAWVITVDPGKVVNITFHNFHLEHGMDCEHDFLQLHDGPNSASRVIGRFCSDQLHGETFTSTHSDIYLWFRSDASVSGTGFSLTWQAVDPVCGRIFNETEHGTIQSPGYPGKYPHNRTCSWLVQVPIGKRIKFMFAILKLEHHENCSYDYLKIYDGESSRDPVIGSYCSTPPEGTALNALVTSGHSATLLFHSDDTVDDDGFVITYVAESVIDGCGGTKTSPQGFVSSPQFPFHYPNNLYCEWLIRIHPDNRIKMTFTEFHLESHARCSFDFVEIYDGTSDASPLLGRFCGTNLPTEILSNTNTVYIRFVTDMSDQHPGFKLEYKTICGGIYTDLTGILTSPYYPDPYPANSICIYDIILPTGYLVNLTITNMEIESHRTCSYDVLQVRDGNTEKSPLLATICGFSAPESIVSTYNRLWVKFVTDGSIQNRGFSAQYEAIEIGCGGIMIEDNGVIASPRHPESYPDSITCTWLIRAPEAHIIQLSFTTFVLEDESNCNYDYVLVEDTDGVQIGKFCGSTRPPVITSLDNTLFVKFITDEWVSHDGFTATYTFLDAAKACTINYYQQSGVIKSPGYPDHYPHSAHCVWTINAGNNRQITLNVTDFNLEFHPECQFDFLEVRNGGYDTSPLIGKYCGDQMMPILRSHSNVMRLEFNSDSSRSARGFQIQFDSSTEGCGGLLTDIRGSIVSPNYPRPYPYNADCEWLLRVSQGSVISLSIVEIDIEGRTICQYDYLEVFDGDSEQSKSILRICNNQQNPGHIVSSSNALLIRFRSDATVAAGGFHLSYQTMCNNKLTKRRGVIESPNFPNPYPHNHNCSWTIEAPPGSNISISFSHLFIEAHDTCDLDYVEILEKQKDDLVQVGKFCGDMTRPPRSIHISANTAVVRLITDMSVSNEGFRLEYAVIGCGGDIYNKPFGEIHSPNYPLGYPRDTVCYWHIWYPPGSQVELTLEDVDIEREQDCRWDFIKIYAGEDVNAPLLGTVCNTLTNNQIYVSNGNHLFIHFHSDFVIMARGFRATFSQVAGAGCGGRFTADESVIMSSNFPNPYNASDDCEWLIEVTKNHLVIFQFYEFEMPEAVNCSSGYVAIYDGKNTSTPLLLKHCGQKPEGIITSTGNQMLVKLVADGINNGKGFRAHYMTGCGSRLLADDGGEITSPHYPQLPNMVNCSWIIYTSDIGQKVSLTITHLFSRPDDNCTVTKLLVYDGDMDDSPLIGQYCGTHVPPPIVSRGSIMHVVMDGTAIFRAVYGLLSEHCGGSYTAPSGSFASPGYPNNYDMEMECIWTIEASAGNEVQISFQAFNLEENDFCNTDYVEIHENDPSGRLIGKYCGNQIPSNITAAHKLWIKFRSDDIGTSPGFMAHYELVHGTVHNGNSGDIASPGYPHKFQIPDSYQWTIMVPSGMFVSIEFREIEIPSIETEESCYSFVKISDGMDEDAPELGQYCGYQVSEPVVTTGNVATVQYHGAAYYPARFYLHWSATNESGVSIPVDPGNHCFLEYLVLPNATEPINVTSPDFPAYYPHNMNCTYIIRTLYAHHIRLEFETFELESSSPCVFDMLQIYTAPNSNVDSWNLNSTLCGFLDPFVISSSNNILKLVMISDSHVTSGGFKAMATAGCGSHIFATEGVLESLSIYPYVAAMRSLQSLQCEWVITVKPRRTIQLHFEEFHVESDDVCSDTYLLLRNGAHSTSPILGTGRYCDRNQPQTLETNSNNAYFQVAYVKKSVAAPVYRLRYTMIQMGCGGHIYLDSDTPSREIFSPNHPNPPGHDIECEWIILSPSGTRMRMDFDEHFNIGPNCVSGEDIEYLDVHDGGTENAELLDRFCGKDPPSSVMTTGNSLFVRYLTSLEHPQMGFKATVRIAQCGGTISAFNEVITSPNYPENYGSSIECEWFLKMKFGYHITLEITDFSTPESSNCSFTDYLEIRDTDANGDLLRTICGTPDTLPIVIEVPGPVAYIKFKTNSAYTAKGFNMLMNANFEEGCGGTLHQPSGVITSPRYPNAFQAERNCRWAIYAPEGRRVKITFEEINLPRDENLDQCTSYVAIYNVTNMPGLRQQDYPYRYCGTTIPGDIDSYTSAVYITFSTFGLNAGQGFSLRFSTDEEAICGGVLPGPNGVIATPNFPVLADTIADCMWRVDTNENKTLSLRFDYLDIPGDIADYCRYNALIVGTTATRFWSVHCGNYTNGLTLTSPYVITKLRLIASLERAFRGFSGTYNTSDCGGVLSGSDTVIASPNYPNNYPPNTDCHWIIEVPDGDVIKLTTEYMNLEQSGENCTKDYVIVRNGLHPESPKIGTFCGSRIPVPIMSAGNSLTVIFHSDEFGNAPGFKMTTADVQKGCGGVIHMFHGNFSSPNYPSRYDSSVECVWIIEYPEGYLVRVVFEGRFDIEMDNTCSKDYLQFEDAGINPPWVVADKKCGSSVPSPFESKANKLRITFFSNEHIVGDGFSLRYSAVCGMHFTKDTGDVRSPNYPNKYTNDLNCTYVIGKPGEFILLNFDDFFSIENDPDCIYDFLEIFQQEETESNSQGKYCGSVPPAPRSLQGPVILKFVTDFSYVATGFKATYQTVDCNKVLTEPSGIIMSPPESDLYSENLDCTWQITAPSDKTIALRFLHMNLSMSYGCRDSYLEVRDGNATGSVIGRFCGSKVWPVVKSRNNQLRLKFRHYVNRYMQGSFKVYYFHTFGEAHGCGGKLNSTSGEVQSLDIDSDGNYEPNLDCGWLILVDVPDQAINITFSRFELEEARNGTCSSDYLELREEGTDGPILGRFCGSSVPLPIISSVNRIFVHFHSDDIINKPGFKFTYRVVPSPCGPSSLIATSEAKTLTSPNYPNPYPVNLRCKWMISPNITGPMTYSTTRSIEITMNDFDIPCGGDYLQVKSVTYSRYSTFTGKDCGSTQTTVVLNGRVEVTFSSDSVSNGAKGFSLTYMEEPCSKNLSSDGGGIRKLFHTSSTRCLINITASEGKTISLYFSHLHMGYNCETTKMDVYDGQTTTAPLLGTYCDSREMNPVFSTGRYLLIDAKGSLRYATYAITYMATDRGRGCGGSLNATGGTISSPFYPSPYNETNECTWHLRVPGYHTIHIFFQSFRLNPSNCDANYLEIYDGPTDDISARIARYCGDDNPQFHDSIHNQIVVKLVTDTTNDQSGFLMYFNANLVLDDTTENFKQYEEDFQDYYY